MARPKPATFKLNLESTGGGAMHLALSGRLDHRGLDQLQDRFDQLLMGQWPQRASLDLAGLKYLDSGGALALALLARRSGEKGVPLELINQSPQATALLGLVDLDDMAQPPLHPAAGPNGLVDQVGQDSLDLADDLVAMVTFVGDFFTALARAARRPHRIRWREAGFYLERAGVDGLPIVGLISFLLGTIIAFMSSLQLSSFGANIYVASLVAVGMVRELGPIMTAVLVAGRSGSAFAAEIGTMKVNEEVEALEVMGYDPVDFLALPKVLASMLAVPILTLYSCLCAIAGGLVVGVVGLHLTPYSYISQTMESLSAFGLVTALIKAVVFGLLIAVIGCQRGFMVRGGPEAVGSATTSAVVTAMFMIIVADAGFAILFYYVL